MKNLFLLFLIQTLLTLAMSKRLNVLNEELAICSTDPLTGLFKYHFFFFYIFLQYYSQNEGYTRNGYCDTNEYDHGTHLVCATVTEEFLKYTKAQGNDLSTAHPPYFPGLKPGDNWCLCVSRWAQAYNHGIRMNVVLPATHINTIDYLRRFNLTLSDLRNQVNQPSA
jgi:uncharacterized protein (DUF2237 family)